MNKRDSSDAVTESYSRSTVQKLSSKMALSVSEEMTQRTGEYLDADRRNLATT